MSDIAAGVAASAPPPPPKTPSPLAHTATALEPEPWGIPNGDLDEMQEAVSPQTPPPGAFFAGTLSPPSTPPPGVAAGEVCRGMSAVFHA